MIDAILQAHGSILWEQEDATGRRPARQALDGFLAGLSSRLSQPWNPRQEQSAHLASICPRLDLLAWDLPGEAPATGLVHEVFSREPQAWRMVSFMETLERRDLPVANMRRNGRHVLADCREPAFIATLLDQDINAALAVQEGEALPLWRHWLDTAQRTQDKALLVGLDSWASRHGLPQAIAQVDAAKATASHWEALKEGSRAKDAVWKRLTDIPDWKNAAGPRGLPFWMNACLINPSIISYIAREASEVLSQRSETGSSAWLYFWGASHDEKWRDAAHLLNQHLPLAQYGKDLEGRGLMLQAIDAPCLKKASGIKEEGRLHWPPGWPSSWPREWLGKDTLLGGTAEQKLRFATRVWDEARYSERSYSDNFDVEKWLGEQGRFLRAIEPGWDDNLSPEARGLLFASMLLSRGAEANELPARDLDGRWSPEGIALPPHLVPLLEKLLPTHRKNASSGRYGALTSLRITVIEKDIPRLRSMIEAQAIAATVTATSSPRRPRM